MTTMKWIENEEWHLAAPRLPGEKKDDYGNQA
jgi:hypothetical protein